MASVEKEKAAYYDLGEMVCDLASIFRPPERLTVAEAAEKYVYLKNPPVYDGPYLNDAVPYMVEPMNQIANRRVNVVCFVGPAQTAKTQSLVLNTLAYTIVCDPKDTILYEKSQSAARDFSKRRLDRMHRHSKMVGKELSPGQHSDNTYDKLYKSGMMFTMSWPSINEMSGKPVPFVILTDYDRMPEDVDGEGAPFDLAQKRTTTFGTFAMTVVESSPGHVVIDPAVKPSTPHEAPPCNGILAIYNRGDRRLWVWPCPDCREFFEPTFKLLKWTDKGDINDTARTTRMACPHCGVLIPHHMKREMNIAGKWIVEGQRVLKDGTVVGDGVRSDIASYWLKGPAATYISWEKLVSKFLQAEQEYQRTGSQDALKTTVNTDQGEPYVMRGSETVRLVEDLMDRAESLPERMVPKEVRALIATVDVQKNRWEVQVHGIAPGNPYTLVVIDRFPIVHSARLNDAGERLWVKPATFPEDWDLLISEVMDRTYPLGDGSGDMRISLTVCDSGGKDGVTANAYNFWRSLKGKGRHDRFYLIKGVSKPHAPRVSLEYPDAQRKDRFASARGEIPLLEINVNINKDTLNGMLDHTKAEQETLPTITFPNWLPREFFEELTVETRGPKGWENPLGRRNESWDLLVYAVACCVWRKVEHVHWENPPTWLMPWAENPLVRIKQEEGQIATTTPVRYGFGELGAKLG